MKVLGILAGSQHDMLMFRDLALMLALGSKRPPQAKLFEVERAAYAFVFPIAFNLGIMEKNMETTIVY